MQKLNKILDVDLVSINETPESTYHIKMREYVISINGTTYHRNASLRQIEEMGEDVMFRQVLSDLIGTYIKYEIPNIEKN